MMIKLSEHRRSYIQEIALVFDFPFRDSWTWRDGTMIVQLPSPPCTPNQFVTIPST